MKELARKETEELQTFEISKETIKQVFMPDASDQELLLAFNMCRLQGLNPFKGEVYFIPFKDKKGKPRYKIVVSYMVFLKRAMRNPQYAGFRAGIIVETPEGKLEFLEGSFKPNGAKLVGGWCEVYRKDWKVPLKHTVNLSEFELDRTPWQKMKAFMIMKVAIAQAHRLAFPEETAGLYIAEEDEEIMGLKTELLKECYKIVEEHPELKEEAERFVHEKGKKSSIELEIDEIEELKQFLKERVSSLS